MIMAWSIPEKKSCFKMMELTLSSKFDMVSYIISISKTLQGNWSLDSFYEVSFS